MLFYLFCCLINFDYLSVFKWQINCISSLPGTCVKCALSTYFFWNVCHTQAFCRPLLSTALRITWPEQGSCLGLSVTTRTQNWFYKVRLTTTRSYIIRSAWKISSKINWYLFTSAVPRLRSGDMLQTFVKWEGASSTSSSPQLHANESKISRFSGANLHLLWTYHL